MAVLVEKMKAFGQRTPWTCGPASLRSIMRFYGVSVPEKELVQLGEIGEDGTDPDTLRRLAHEYGMKFYSRHNARMTDLERWIVKDNPVLVLMQDHGKNNGKNGHYCIVSGLSQDYVILADPAYSPDGKFTKQRRMKKADFLSRWWGMEDFGDLYKQWFAVIRPR